MPYKPFSGCSSCLKIIFLMVVLIGIAMAAAGTGTPGTGIADLIKLICTILTAILPILIFILVIISGITYGLGNTSMFDSETRAKLRSWGLSAFIAVIVMILIYVIAPLIIGFVIGTSFCTLCACDRCGQGMQYNEQQQLCCAIGSNVCCPEGSRPCSENCPGTLNCPTGCCNDKCECGIPPQCTGAGCSNIWTACVSGYSDCNTTGSWNCNTTNASNVCFGGVCTIGATTGPPPPNDTCMEGWSDCDNDNSTSSDEGGAGCECNTGGGEFTCCGGKCVATPTCTPKPVCTSSLDCCPGQGCCSGQCKDCSSLGNCAGCGQCCQGCQCDSTKLKCAACTNPDRTVYGQCDLLHPCCCGFQCKPETKTCELIPTCTNPSTCDATHTCCFGSGCVGGVCQPCNNFVCTNKAICGCPQGCGCPDTGQQCTGCNQPSSCAADSDCCCGSKCNDTTHTCQYITGGGTPGSGVTPGGPGVPPGGTVVPPFTPPPYTPPIPPVPPPPPAGCGHCGPLTESCTLTNDLGPADLIGGSCIDFSADNIYLNCAGHSITGTGSGLAFNSINRQGVAVVNCKINNFTHGVYSQASSIIVTGNTINNTLFGIKSTNTISNAIFDNIIDNARTCGIYSWGDSNTVNTIIKNKINNSKGYGLYLYSGSAEISENEIKNSNLYGLYWMFLTGSLTKNTICGSGSQDIYCYGLTLTSVSGNTFDTKYSYCPANLNTTGPCACKAPGIACSTGTDCCSEVCTGNICIGATPPLPPGCVLTGGNCQTAADCCSSFCNTLTGKCECKNYGETCTQNAQCCGFLTTPSTSECRLLGADQICCNTNCLNKPECQTGCCDSNCNLMCTTGTIQSCTAADGCAGTQTCNAGVFGSCTKTNPSCTATTACISGMISFWKGENNANDSVGTSNGQPKGGVVTFTNGQVGQAFSFNGNSYVDTGTYFPSLTNEFTIEAWVRPGATQTTYADIFGNHGDDGRKRGIVCQQNANTLNQYSIGYGNGTDWIGSNYFSLTTNAWHHLVIVKNSTRLQIYVNNTLVSDTPAATPLEPRPDLNFMIGLGYYNSRYFNGLIDEVAVYNRALTTTEIQQHYRSGSAGQDYCNVISGCQTGTTQSCQTTEGCNGLQTCKSDKTWDICLKTNPACPILCPQNDMSDCNNTGDVTCVLAGGAKECWLGKCQTRAHCNVNYSDCDNNGSTSSVAGGIGCECLTGDKSHYCCGGKCVESCTSGSSQTCTTADNCAGTQTCTGGAWGNCIKATQTCTTADNCPGTRTCNNGIFGSCIKTDPGCPTTSPPIPPTPPTPPVVDCGKCGTLNDNCTLTKDLGPADIALIGGQDCITIGKDNIYLNCAGHSITGNGKNYWGIGVYSINKQGVTIRNCNISKFREGIFSNSSSLTIASNTINDTVFGIYSYLSNNSIQDNIVNNTDMYGIICYLDNDIITSNTVNNANLYGAIIDYGTTSSFANNRICGSGSSDIYCISPSLQSVSGNTFATQSGCPANLIAASSCTVLCTAQGGTCTSGQPPCCPPAPPAICNSSSKCGQCIADAANCVYSMDCCSKVCVGGKCCGGPWTCCSRMNESCQRTSECCGTMVCTSNKCQ